MSLRFEKLMAEHRLNSADADKTEVELLQMLVERYNSYKSTSAIRKWQITDDMRKSIEGIIIGMTSRTRQLIRAHLDYNKWEESGHWPAQYIGPFSLVLKGCLYCFCVFSVRIQRVAFESEAASAPWVTTRADTLLDTNLDRNFALHWVETFYFVFLNAKHQELYGCIYEYIFLQYIYIWISLAHLLQGLRGFAGASLLQVQPVVVYEREESQENMQGKAEVERGNLGKTCWPMLPGNLGDSRKRKATWGYNLSLHKTRTSKNTVEIIYIYICGSKPVLKVTDQMLQNMLTTFTNGCLAQTNVLLILFLCHCQLHHKFWTKPAWKFEA